ncbi:unnamed protein product [Gongylonema pulchrum]|uniref:MSP domain-containing protein n=1 Tax=Gongylonema pulchrum TaxID=637853 RepID=A0A183D567_9BILA|nr:unnamed protein product [Gongylonema pulchrum]
MKRLNDVVDTKLPPYMTNDRFIWTTDEPDVELIEPKILASIDKNWLTFGLQAAFPPQSHTFTLYNHGDHALAFTISTSDNYAYFVSKVVTDEPGVNERPSFCFLVSPSLKANIVEQSLMVNFDHY